MKNAKQFKSANENTQVMKQKKHAARIRRQTNESWQVMEKTGKYRKANSKDACRRTFYKITDEVMDGILLNLNGRHNESSSPVRMRILRRIVEKRQAQATYRKNGRTTNLRYASEVAINTRKCMEWLHRVRFAS